MPQETEHVTINIDGVDYQVPAGMNLVDAAKFYADNDIPVFCYHPKLDPVGMCRMCLVEQGSVARDRATGEVQYDDDGNPQIRWFPKLQTACTQLVSDGMYVRTNTEHVQDARDDVIEFLLTSHPLDCPICDKGGECPLQNLTMRHGPGQSRFNFDDKMRLDKHVPLGELIFLDRERCIQCARCTRYCDELVGDPVLGFHERGRALQIVTLSDPPFDTYFSGNTTDICPVGALTTADFRFGARPWELNEVPSLDPYGPEGANISLSTRLDRDAGGKMIVKRVMPRQNEYVNEIWISDKTRFGHHHSRAANRLTEPMIRKDGELTPVSWEEALAYTAEQLAAAEGAVGAVAGPMLSNEDLWELRGLVEHLGGEHLGVWPATMSGAEVVAQVGVATGTNLTDIGRETAVLVIASDLEEEAPIWWLRAKRAGDRGAKIMVANARKTKLDRYAKCTLRYDYGATIEAVNHLINAILKADGVDDGVAKRAEGLDDVKKAKYGRLPKGYSDAATMLLGCENLIVIAGHEGVSLAEHAQLMQALANLLILTGRVGKPNNGLIPVWPGANTQGAFDLGYSAEATADALRQKAIIIAGADPVGTDPASTLADAEFVVVSSLFETATTAQAHVVLPRQSVPERDGTFTSGERRVQRFYTAQGFLGETRPDWRMFAGLHHTLDNSYRVQPSAGAVMATITQGLSRYADMGYKNLALTERQFPDVGGEDLYYGGTAYGNQGGLGRQWPVLAEDEESKLTMRPVEANATEHDGLLAVPVHILYDRSPEFWASTMMHGRIPEPFAQLNRADAETLGVADQDHITLSFGTSDVTVVAHVNGNTPQGVVLVPWQLADTPVPTAPTSVTISKLMPESR
ncbi:MAG: NADH-quinone oxidoreductase subunit NuoG [Anaerolineales bacterium]